MTKSFLSILILLSALNGFSQKLTLQQKLNSNLNLQAQFDAIIAQSKTIDVDFKAVRKTNIEIIQKNVSDSIAKYTKEIATLKNSSASSVSNLTSIQDSLKTAQQELTIERQKTDSISFLGIDFAKGLYHTIVWSLIAIFALAFIVVLASFRKAKVNANEHQKTAEEAQNNFQTFKKKAMETEQKLKRQLLDEQLKGDS